MSQNSLRYYLSQAQIRSQIGSKNNKPLLTSKQAMVIKYALKNMPNIKVKLFSNTWKQTRGKHGLTYASSRRSFENIIADLKTLAKKTLKQRRNNKLFITAAASIKKSRNGGLPNNVERIIYEKILKSLKERPGSGFLD